MRAATYARYSTDLQNEASIEDQIRLCRAHIERQGWSYVVAYHDRAVSGASRLRPGYQKLLSDARRGDFDVVVAEALDRLSRDQEDIAHLYKLLSFAGVTMVTLAEGEITELHIGLKGTMNALYLKDLADKTRRGLRGRVEAGQSGGGNSYGYSVVHSARSDGASEAGGRSINQAEAEVVRRIFTAYSSGISPREIAKSLNREKIHGPSGQAWGPSTINGNASRGTGILNNELYIGRMVWNRLTYRKDPISGKRRSRLNPVEQWVTKDVPNLRIVPQPLWDAVKARQGAMARETRPEKGSNPFWSHQRPRYLLSGLMKCGCCGANYTKYGSNRFACAGARDRATCSNTLTVHGEELEATILAGLKERLMQPDLFKVFADEFVAEMNRQRSGSAAERDALRSELHRVTRQIDRLVDAIVNGANALAINDKLKELEARKADISRKISAMPADEPLLHPALASLYRDQVARLSDALAAPDTRQEAFQLVRGLIESVKLIPVNGKLEVELRGDLAAILSITVAAKASRYSAEDKALQIKVVAGAGFDRDLKCNC